MMPFDEELESRSNKFHKIEIRLRVEICLDIELRMNIQKSCNFDSYLDSTLEFVSRQFLSPTLLPRTFAKGIFTTTRGSTTPTVRFLLYKKMEISISEFKIRKPKRNLGNNHYDNTLRRTFF